MINQNARRTGAAGVMARTLGAATLLLTSTGWGALAGDTGFGAVNPKAYQGAAAKFPSKGTKSTKSGVVFDRNGDPIPDDAPLFDGRGKLLQPLFDRDGNLLFDKNGDPILGYKLGPPFLVPGVGVVRNPYPLTGTLPPGYKFPHEPDGSGTLDYQYTGGGVRGGNRG
jgi:hypothetical protein